MGKKSRDKGKVGEREVASLIEAHGFEARRGVQHSGGPGSPDVVHSIPYLHIEVKRTERLALYKALQQAEADAADDDVPVVFHRCNGQRWVAILDADDFLTYMEDLHE